MTVVAEKEDILYKNRIYYDHPYCYSKRKMSLSGKIMDISFILIFCIFYEVHI